MTTGDISLSNAKSHIELLSRTHQKLNQTAELEIRAISERHPTQSLRFIPNSKESVDQAIQFAKTQNFIKKNIYITPLPITLGGKQNVACKDTEIIAATHCFLDADEKGVAEQLIEEWKEPPDFIVVTGEIPYLRIHAYWEFVEPVFDLKKWVQLQQFLIDAHFCDQVIKNPSRVMRLAGFRTYPTNIKQQRGYTSELVKINEQGEYYDLL